jgi:hypothetical protein
MSALETASTHFAKLPALRALLEESRLGDIAPTIVAGNFHPISTETQPSAQMSRTFALQHHSESLFSTKGKRSRGVSSYFGGFEGPSNAETGQLHAASAVKGLKHFSVKVCEKVEAKGHTNYNEVADELVREMGADAEAGLADGAFDEKNVRRRVYDALNVLEALGIISKTKKDIDWKGWPATLNQSEKTRLEAERSRLLVRVQSKLTAVEETTAKAYCISNLVLRNRDAPLPVLEAAKNVGLPAPTPLRLPFMIAHAPSNASIDLQISNDEKVAELDFKWWPFEIFDDVGVMKMMGLDEPRPELLGIDHHDHPGDGDHEGDAFGEGCNG